MMMTIIIILFQYQSNKIIIAPLTLRITIARINDFFTSAWLALASSPAGSQAKQQSYHQLALFVQDTGVAKIVT